ncbi:MAG: beta-lactamase family protein [Alphaproteobacteria bacterium]|nr:beta-lactamase family protein [Alphaproteobacteria bacterium]
MRPGLTIIPIILGFLISSTTLRATEIPQSIDQAAVESILKEAAEKGFEGIVGISDEDGIFYLRAYGDAVKGVTPYDEGTLADIASITKQFTGAAILKLREQGKLKLDDRLDRFFMDIPADKAAITIHQLLTHTAGMPAPGSIGRDEEAIGRDDYLRRLFAAPLQHRPGTVHEYSNEGYSLLAAIIELASGLSYESYLFENIWKPAGMYHTGYSRPDWSGHSIPEIEKPVAGLVSQKQLLDSTQGQFWHLMGNGGLLSTVGDMLIWHRALLGADILNEESKKLLFAPHVSEGEEGFYYGYGWAIEPGHPAGSLVWHNGGSYFSRAEFWRLPKSGYGIFIATHTDAVEPYFTADALARLMGGSKKER